MKEWILKKRFNYIDLVVIGTIAAAIEWFLPWN